MKIDSHRAFRIWLIYMVFYFIISIIVSFLFPTWVYLVTMVILIFVNVLLIHWGSKIRAKERNARLQALSSISPFSTYPEPPKEEPVDNPSDRRDKD